MTGPPGQAGRRLELARHAAQKRDPFADGRQALAQCGIAAQLLFDGRLLVVFQRPEQVTEQLLRRRTSHFRVIRLE